MNYDVFISCKSEDYKCAEAIYDYLKNNDIHAFLASKELRQMGESEYRHAISKAMKSAYHIIVFASKAEFIDSTWVYYEWDMFLNAKLKGRKEGQILTILKDIEVDDINMDLWKYESFTFENFREGILTYIETPDSRRRKEQAKRKAQEEAEKIAKQKQEEQKINQIKKEIEDKEAEYFRYLNNLNRLAKDIIEKRKDIGENKKVCPICNESTFIDTTYCRKCGWTFIPTFSTKPSVSEEQLFIARSNWDFISKESKKRNIDQIEDIQKEHQQAIKEIENLKEEIERLEMAYKDMKTRFTEMTAERDSLLMQIQKLKKKDKEVKDAEMLYQVGYNSYYGINNSERNSLLAFSYLQQASLLSHRKAQALLAKCYYLGIGVKPNKEKGQYWEHQSTFIETHIFSSLTLPKSLAFEFKGRKFFMILSDDERFYLGNISAKDEDLSWWNNKWIQASGATAICAGAVLFSFVTLPIAIVALFKTLGGLFSEQKNSEETEISITSDVCKAISEQTGYKFDIPTEDELFGVSEKARKSCIVLRLKDNRMLISDSNSKIKKHNDYEDCKTEHQT